MTKAEKRVTHRSSKGPKLYPLRKKKSRFADIVAYKRGHEIENKIDKVMAEHEKNRALLRRKK